MSEQHFLRLPQLVIAFPFSPPDGEHILIIGGRPPEGAWLRAAAKNRAVWAVDRGIDLCKACGIFPARLIGDGDSASPEAWRWGEELAIPVDRYPSEKDLTDTQIALAALDSLGRSFAVVTGAFGGRFDHAFSTIFSCAHAQTPCVLADEREILFFLKGKMEVSVSLRQSPAALSLLPLAEVCDGVSVGGVRWPLADARLLQAMPYAVSNVPVGENFRVALGEGVLGVYLAFRPAEGRGGFSDCP